MIQNSFFRKLYNYFIEHWFISALLSTAPAFVFTFIEIFGVNFGLVSDTAALTPLALWILWPIFIFSLLFSFIMALADKRDEFAKRNGQFVLSRTIQSLDEIKHKKLKRFTRYIDQNHGRKDLSPFRDITQPTMQMESILENFQDTMSDIFGIRHNDIGISLMYRTDKDRIWRWLYTANIEGDLSIEEIIDNPNTTARQIIDNKTNSLFCPSKKSAVLQGHYIPSSKDHSNRMIGSILCKDISIGTNKYVEAILSLSTYGHQLCLENDNDAKFKIEEILLPSFERRIQLELALLYIRDVLSVQPQ